jgi:hypothetical protein
MNILGTVSFMWYTTYMIQISSHDRTWVNSIAHHQATDVFYLFIHLFMYLLTYLLT